MLFRPLELCWNKFQKGFSLFSFAFPDESYYSFLAVVYLEEINGWYLALGFFGWQIGTGEEEDDDPYY